MIPLARIYIKKRVTGTSIPENRDDSKSQLRKEVTRLRSEKE
jgi:hypothetical protein